MFLTFGLLERNVEAVRGIWEAKHGMEGMRMFVVTGATGHTGKIVAKALLAKGEKVREKSKAAGFRKCKSSLFALILH